MRRFLMPVSTVLIVLAGACNEMAGPTPSPSPSPSPTPSPGARFKPEINTELAPQQAAIPDAEGSLQTVACSRDAKGVQSDFLEGLILLRPASDADLTAFLNRFEGSVVDDDAVPEPPATLGITLTDEQRRPTEYLVRINLDAVDAAGLAANGAAAGIEGLYEFSSEAGMQTFSGVAQAFAEGFDVSPVQVSYPNQAFPMTVLSTQERPDGMGGFTDAFATTRFQASGSASNVTAAWQFLAAHGIQRRVQVAIIDGGFWLNTDGSSRGTDSDFPANPVQYDFVADDYFADGPNVTACGTGNPCFWHGTGAASVAAGFLNNMLGDAGTGGQIADVMLFKMNGQRNQINRAIRTAVAWGADVVSMSFGGDCNQGCRIYDREHTPISDAVDAGSRTVFLSAAGNGRGNPAAGYEVSDPSFFHPCIEDHVVCVGALANDVTTKIGYSNFGARVDIFAPTNIPVMAQPASTDNNPAGPASPATFGGTSASTPFVAGVAAMIKAIDPNLNGDQVGEIIRATAYPGAGQVTRYIDAYSALRRAALDIAIVEDRFDAGAGNDLTPTDLAAPAPYNQANLNLDERDRDYFKFESPGSSTMTVNLQYPVTLGDLALLNVESLGECGMPTYVSDGSLGGGSGHQFVYRVPGGPIQLGIDAQDINAYNLGISFTSAILAPDDYEPNETDATAKWIYSLKRVGSGLLKRLGIDPRFTIQVNLHSNFEQDHYIVRGVTPTFADILFLGSVPTLKVFGNESALTLVVNKLNPDNTKGTLVASLGGGSCAAQPLAVRLDSEAYYLVTVAGTAGRYTLSNGVDGGRLRLPILARDHVYTVLHPGDPVERAIRFPELLVFAADRAFSAIDVGNPNLHLELFDFDNNFIAQGQAQSGLGERLDLLSTVQDQIYALRVTPLMPSSEDEMLLDLEWDDVAPSRTSENLILNPGAEVVLGEEDLSEWSAFGDLPLPRLYFYDDQEGYPSTTGPGPDNRGFHLFAGGNNQISGMRQSIFVAPDWQQPIYEGRAKFRFAAYLGGYLGESDSASATLTFVDANEQILDQVKLPSVTRLEREDETGLLPVEVVDYLPFGTFEMHVDVTFNGPDGEFNDGYADNFELVLLEFQQ
ncbi:MAG TPA: S8/S53 family peptidase [Phycisphaerae bacterium]|nr:S8/S53 family peptidase [Phycisphaerae bacterium]